MLVRRSGGFCRTIASTSRQLSTGPVSSTGEPRVRPPAAKFDSLPPKTKALLEKIIRVDHAGELAADRIYAGQMAVLGKSPVGSIIKKMWDEEREHLDTMERLATRHHVPHTIFSPLFCVAAYALGAGTALLGKESAMACTVAVEELIGHHYNDQLKELIADDPVKHEELLKTLTRLRDDELHHHDTGVEHKGLQAPFYDAMKFVIQSGCKAAIFVAEKV